MGASRGLRRLSVTPIDREDLEAAEGQPTEVTVDISATLEEALAAMMRYDDGQVAVTQNGDTVGVLTPNSVHRALRRSVSES